MYERGVCVCVSYTCDLSTNIGVISVPLLAWRPEDAMRHAFLSCTSLREGDLLNHEIGCCSENPIDPSVCALVVYILSL